MMPKTIRSIVVTGLLMASLLLWVSSMDQAALKVARQGIGDFGLISVLPLVYFLSLSLLTISFLAALKFDGTGATQLFCVMMLVLFLYLTPAIVEGTPRFGSTYVYYRSVDYISETGRTNPDILWVHNWPAFSIAFSTVVQITGLAGNPHEQVFLSIYPALLNIVLFLPLFSLVRIVLHQEKTRWAAVWLFYCANWVDQSFFNAQGLAFFAFILLLVALFRLMQSPSKRWVLISVLLFLCLATGHLLTSLASIMLTFVLFAFKQFRRPPTNMVAMFVLVLAAWTIYGASAHLQFSLSRVISEGFNFDLLLRAGITSRVTTGNAVRNTVNEIRIFFSALAIMLAVAGFFAARKYGRLGPTDRRFLLITASLLPLLSLFAYGGELIMRIFLFCLVPIVYFACRGSDRKYFFPIVAIFLLIAAPPLNIVAHYGNEAYDYVPVSEAKGLGFFYDSTKNGYVIGFDYHRDIRYRDQYEYIPFEAAPWRNDRLSLGAQSHHWPTYVCVFYWAREWYSFFLADPQFVPTTVMNLTASAAYDKVYSNPSFEAYLEL